MTMLRFALMKYGIGYHYSFKMFFEGLAFFVAIFVIIYQT
jgi:hypothetical protein